jgi:hypothetical protein
LFSEEEQQLHRLDGASALLVPMLVEGASYSQLISELTRSGVSPDAAENWVTGLLHQLAGLSLLQTSGGDLPPSARSAQHLAIGPLRVSVSYSSLDLQQAIAPIFRHLESEQGPGAATIRIAEFGAGLVEVGIGPGSALLVRREEVAIRLKGMLLEEVLRCDCALGALHAAFLSRNGNGVLLLGSPGAGKSTLALALLGAGFEYGSDDVTLFRGGGTVMGVPLAPAVKEGAWAIAETMGIALTPLPAHVRPDGKLVRFACIARDRLTESGRISMIVSLRREQNGTAGLRPMGSENALGAMLGEARSRSGRCSVDTMSALAQLVRGASCFHLHYPEAMQAVDLITSVVGRG